MQSLASAEESRRKNSRIVKHQHFISAEQCRQVGKRLILPKARNPIEKQQTGLLPPLQGPLGDLPGGKEIV